MGMQPLRPKVPDGDIGKVFGKQEIAIPQNVIRESQHVEAIAGKINGSGAEKIHSFNGKIKNEGSEKIIKQLKDHVEGNSEMSSSQKAMFLEIFSNMEKNLDKLVVPMMDNGERVVKDGITQMIQGHLIPHEQFALHAQNNEVGIILENTVFLNPNIREEIGAIALVDADGDTIREDLEVKNLSQEEAAQFSTAVSDFVIKKNAQILQQQMPQETLSTVKENEKQVHDNVSTSKMAAPGVQNGRIENKEEVVDHSCIHLNFNLSLEISPDRAKERRDQEKFDEKAEKTAKIIKQEVQKFEQKKQETEKEETSFYMTGKVIKGG